MSLKQIFLVYEAMQYYHIMIHCIFHIIGDKQWHVIVAPDHTWCSIHNQFS